MGGVQSVQSGRSTHSTCAAKVIIFSEGGLSQLKYRWLGVIA